MEVGFYQRKEGDVGTLGFNFVTNETNGGLLWDGRHLRVHFPQSPIAPQISMNLVWHENLHSWTGHFERGSFSRDLVLLRPENSHKSSFVGTWFNRSQLMNNCVHIAQQEDGGFTAWGDDILVPGRMRYANGIHPPDESRERYAEIAKAKLIAKDRISLELRAYTAVCCSHPFSAKIAGDEKTLQGSFPAGPNQAPRGADWVRMPGDSCIAAASSR